MKKEMNKKNIQPQRKKINQRRLLLFCLIIRSANAQVTEYDYDYKAIKAIDNELGAISSISRLKVELQYTNFFIFYQQKSGEIHGARIKIEDGLIKFVDGLGQIQPSQQPVPLTKKVTSSQSESDPDNIPYNFVLTLDQDSKSFNLYNFDSFTSYPTSMNELTSSHDIIIAKYMSSSSSNVLFYHAFINNKLTQIKIFGLPPNVQITNNDYFPKIGVPITSASKISNSYLNTLWGIISINNLNDGEVRLVAVQSQYFPDSDFPIVTYLGSPLRCDIVGMSDREKKFICGINGQQLKIYEVYTLGGTPPSTVSLVPADEAVTMKTYYRITMPKIPPSVTYTETRILYILGEKVNGDRGISICRVSTLEEEYFHKIGGTWSDDEVVIFNSRDIIVYEKKTDYQNPELIPPFIKHIDFENLSGVVDCKTNKVKGDFLSKKCGECDGGKYVDPEPNGPDGACVSTCTKGIKDVAQRLCFSSAECDLNTLPNCLTCKTGVPGECGTCVENFKLQGKFCFKRCKVPESYQKIDGKCFDCLSNNNCEDCDDYSKNCNACKEGYELKGPENKICTKICLSPNFYFSNLKCIGCLAQNNCKSCNYPNGFCNECKEGYFRDKIDKKKCLRCIEADIRCIQCKTSSGCTKCQPGYKVVEGKCQLICSEDHLSWSSIEAKCVDCTLNNCSKCEDLTQECQECNGDQFQLDQKNNKICSLKCPEDHSSWSSKEAKCVDCTLNNCSKCEDLTQECQECKEGFKIDPLDKKKCLEIIEGKIQFSHKFSKTESLSDLTFRLTLSHQNGTEIDYKIPFNNTKEKSRMRIFNITEASTSEILPSYTAYDSDGNLFTYVNLTDAFKDKTDIELNFEIFNQKINDDIKLEKKSEIGKNVKVKIPKKKAEINSFTSTITDSTNPNEGISTTAVMLDPTGIMAKATQYIKMVNRFVFLNIDFGEKLTQMLETSAGVSKTLPKNRILTGDDYLLSKDGSKGKFDLYRIPLKFEGNLAIKTIGYLSSWSLLLIEFLILRKIGKEKKISRCLKFVVFGLRKIKFSLLMSFSLDIVFLGGRFMLHSKNDLGAVLKKSLVALSMMLIVIDFLLIYKSIENFVRKKKLDENIDEKNKEGEAITPQKIKPNRVIPQENLSESVQMFNIDSDDEEENNQAGINHDSNIKEGVIASFEGSGEEEKEFELDKGKEDKIHRLNKDTPQFMRRADRIYNFDEMSQAPRKYSHGVDNYFSRQQKGKKNKREKKKKRHSECNKK